MSAALAARPGWATSPAAVQVDAAFPGGNIIFHGVQGDTVFIERELRDTIPNGDYFYYYFRARGGAGRKLTFKFLQPNSPMLSRGPAVSTNGGTTWNWLGAGAVYGASFRYAWPAGVSEVRFCMAMPYLEANLRAFLNRYKGNPYLECTTLCQTRKNREAELLRLGRLDGNCEQRAIIVARHHACEMMAGHSLEGLMEEILSASPDGRWLREHVEFMVVPFVDKDGVEDGDQGKDRYPFDDNQDYAGESIHPTVAAIRKLAPEWSGGKLRFTLDMHCPWQYGYCHEVIYGIGEMGPGDREGNRFGEILESVETGPLRFRRADYAPCIRPRIPAPRATGSSSRTSDPQAPRPKRPMSFRQWARGLPGIRLSAYVEIPYSTASGREVDIASAKAFGQDLARAIRRYLESGSTASAALDAGGERR